MIYSLDQLKHLEPDGEETWKYVENGVATEDEKRELRKLDANFFALFHSHFITNVEDIK